MLKFKCQFWTKWVMLDSAWRKVAVWYEYMLQDYHEENMLFDMYKCCKAGISVFGQSLIIHKNVNEYKIQVTIYELLQQSSPAPRCVTMYLNHPSLVMQICAVNKVSIGSDNSLSPIRCQFLVQTNAWWLSLGPLGTNFSKLLVKIRTLLRSKMSFEKLQTFFFISVPMC